jgi:NAD(P)-dependent dehydrogenase (short-subunit alcohol dehydrogenase family)
MLAVSDLPPPRDLLDLTGKVVVVTGAGGGIGAGIASRMAAAGASVVAHTRSSLVAELPGKHVVATADLLSDRGPHEVIDAALQAFGRVDGLVNNAGVQPIGKLIDLTEDDWRSMIDTNLTAVHRLSQVAATTMIDRNAPGSIVHVASIEGIQPAPMHGHYAAAKAALIMHARAAALEWGAEGIRVNVVSPGLIDRPGLENDWPEGVHRWLAAAPLRRLGTPEDVGDACVFLCSDLSRWVSGVNLVVDGGVLAHPTW